MHALKIFNINRLIAANCYHVIYKNGQRKIRQIKMLLSIKMSLAQKQENTMLAGKNNFA